MKITIEDFSGVTQQWKLCNYEVVMGVVDMEVGMVVDMEVDKVADTKVDKVSNMVVD